MISKGGWAGALATACPRWNYTADDGLPKMKICPFCEQDFVWRVRLKSNQRIHFSMCFECDSVWGDGQTISDQAGTTFDKHMRAFGIEPDWEDIERIDRYGSREN